MAESLDAFRYISYLKSRWRLIAGSCAAAATIALVVSLAMPRQYTATARIVIDPPAGTDVRAAVAVSPIYLESLRTYEQFASGDSLFLSAAKQFGLGEGPIESRKKRVLRVGLLRNTRILEISATLPDPKTAQALAQFLAQATVEMSRSLTAESDNDLVNGISRQQGELRKKVEESDAEWARLLLNEPTQPLQTEAENSATLQAGIEQQLSNVGLEIADLSEREKALGGSEGAEMARQQNNARARRDQLQNQLAVLAKQSAERERVLAARTAHRERVEAERKTAQTQLMAVETQLREARGGAGYRGERLKVIDPGIVPERPSSPNLPLNVAGAMLLGLLLPVLWLAFEMNYQQQRAGGRRSGFQALG